MIDPYGHPLTLPAIKNILSRQRTEALITLMWYRINMDLSNPMVQANVDRLFGDNQWRCYPLMSKMGNAEERTIFLNTSYLGSPPSMSCRLRISTDPESELKGKRTKYYLLRASNNSRAVLLMKEVMWPLGDEDGTFDFSVESQGVLISRTPQLDELRGILLSQFAGRELAFDSLREEAMEATVHRKALSRSYPEVALGRHRDSPTDIIKEERAAKKRLSPLCRS